MDKEVQELVGIIKECGGYSSELDGYVVNPTTASCKILNAGYTKPSPMPDLEKALTDLFNSKEIWHIVKNTYNDVAIDDPILKIEYVIQEILSLISQPVEMKLIDDETIDNMDEQFDWGENPKLHIPARYRFYFLQAQLAADQQTASIQLSQERAKVAREIFDGINSHKHHFNDEIEININSPWYKELQAKTGYFAKYLGGNE